MEEPASFQKTTDKHYKDEYLAYFKNGALTIHIKKAHNISNNITKKEFMAIFHK